MYLPVGTVLPYAGPMNENTKNELKNSGYLFCDGSAYKKDKYPRLYSVINDAYAYAYGKDAPPPADQFRVPDYRGLFLRGCDSTKIVDKDFATREHGDKNGDKVGSKQSDCFREHTHVSGYQKVGAKTDGGPWVLKNSQGNDYRTERTDPPGGIETRPKNIYVNYIIFVGF